MLRIANPKVHFGILEVHVGHGNGPGIPDAVH
ncbi:hypothetical protein ABLN97_04165 [Mycobacterium tuberculosis]